MGTIKISHYKIRIADPQARPVQPYSMVLLADLHNAVFGVHNEELCCRQSGEQTRKQCWLPEI